MIMSVFIVCILGVGKSEGKSDTNFLRTVLGARFNKLLQFENRF